MKIAAKRIFESRQKKGINMLKCKSELFKAKKMGVLFFHNDVASMNESDTVNIYLSYFPNLHGDKSAFPVPRSHYKKFINDKERFYFLKKYYEDYYQGYEMDYNLYKSFDSTPYESEKYFWFFKKKDCDQ